MESQSETYQTVSVLKLPVLKTREYDLWSMRMERYLTFTDHDLWEVIVNGDSVSPVASASTGAEAIPNEHLLNFHACKDAKSLWEAIKNRFGGNKESKKMQKTILKQNYENITASSQEGLDKTYDRFQTLISQLEIHDTLSMDNLYNNLKVYEYEIKGKSSSSSNSQNVAFVSSDNSSSTNETVNTAYSIFVASSKDQASTASYADDIDVDDLEEMDFKWEVEMLTMNALVVQDGMSVEDCDVADSLVNDRFNISKDIVEKPKTDRPSAPIIEEWDTDSDNDSYTLRHNDSFKNNDETKEDIISNLPDSLLIDIISLLSPSEQVKETRVLVDQTLAIHGDIPIEKLLLKCEKKCDYDCFYDLLCTLVRFKAGVRELELSVLWDLGDRHEVKFSWDLFKAWDSLVGLTLDCGFILDVYNDDELIFPCLKKISLICIGYASEESVVNLISSCPLEEWYVREALCLMIGDVLSNHLLATPIRVKVNTRRRAESFFLNRLATSSTFPICSIAFSVELHEKVLLRYRLLWLGAGKLSSQDLKQSFRIGERSSHPGVTTTSSHK
ncbi:ribonuclease H-like domain-containing protein [Tanacetum coccineum]